jgi:hypothetical protein
LDSETTKLHDDQDIMVRWIRQLHNWIFPSPDQGKTVLQDDLNTKRSVELTDAGRLRPPDDRIRCFLRHAQQAYNTAMRVGKHIDQLLECDLRQGEARLRLERLDHIRRQVSTGFAD